jgi:hypothetical protein
MVPNALLLRLTGNRAIQAAKLYPEAEVLAVDMNPLPARLVVTPLVVYFLNQTTPGRCLPMFATSSSTSCSPSRSQQEALTLFISVWCSVMLVLAANIRAQHFTLTGCYSFRMDTPSFPALSTLFLPGAGFSSTTSTGLRPSTAWIRPPE